MIRRAVEGRRVQRDRVGQQRPADHLGDEALPGRVVERRADAEQERARRYTCQVCATPVIASTPSSGDAAGQPELGQLEHGTLGEPVRDQPADRGQQQHRQELQRGRDADRDTGAVGQLQHEPVLGDPLHPGADVRDERAGHPDPVVANRQRGEHPRTRLSGGRAPGGSSRSHRSRRRWSRRPRPRRSGSVGSRGSRVAHPIEDQNGSRSTSRSLLSSCSICSASHSSRRRRLASRIVPAGVGQRDETLPPIALGRLTDHQPALLETVHDPRHRRRLDPLEPRPARPSAGRRRSAGRPSPTAGCRTGRAIVARIWRSRRASRRVVVRSALARPGRARSGRASSRVHQAYYFAMLNTTAM